MADIGDGRPLRVCDLCGGVDDHPRHVIAGAIPDVFPRVADDIVDKVLSSAPEQDRGRLLRDLLDTGSSDRHKDCCRVAGCPTGECAAELDEVGDLRGSELRDALTERGQRLQNQEG